METQKPHDVWRRVGRRIAAARRAAGLTQRELAQRLHWPPDTLIHYEHGRRALAVDRLVAIATALHQHPATLLIEDDALALLIERVSVDAQLGKQITFFLDTLATEQNADVEDNPHEWTVAEDLERASSRK
jgi:transcriptional regulator with XRE-family HTH domain